MKKAILILVTILSLFGVLAFNTFATDLPSEGACGENVIWAFSGDTLTISGTGPMDNFKSFYSSPWSEHSENITKVIVEPGVTAIGKYAFAALTNLTSATIPNTVTRIEESAYNLCWQLPNIDIPNSVTYIGESAFYYCSGLTSLILPDSLESCGPSAFAQCNGLKYIQISSNLTEMPYELFSGCYSLPSITIPASVQNIENFVFRNCENLRAIVFEGDAPTFSESTFLGVTATAIYPAGNSSWTEETLQSYDGVITWHEQGKDIPESTFSDQLTWAIKDNTLYITGDGYMRGWSYTENSPWYNYRGIIHKVVMSGNMENIYSEAFRGCSLLTEVVFPSNLKYIYSGVFKGCISLEQIHIPESVSSIDSAVFQDCYSLKRVTLPEQITRLSGGMFSYCTSLETVTVPSNVHIVDSSVFADCTNLKTVYFTGDMPTFAGGAYYPGSFSQTFGVKVYYPADNATWTDDEVQKLEDFYTSGQIECIPIRNIADFNKDGLINNNDVILLLWHTLFPEDYPLAFNCDINADLSVDNNDVVLLLWHTLFPTDYPI